MSHLTENVFEELKIELEGDIYTDKLRRNMLSTDGSIFRVEPLCVVYPKTVKDVQAVCKFAHKYNFSIHSRGTGSGLCGSAIGQGIVLDFTKYMNKLISIERTSDEAGVFTCQPGYKYGELEAKLKGTGLFFPPSPSSGEYATFGGMYGTNASGGYSVKYGNVADYIEDAEIVFHDGTVTTLSAIEATPFEELSVTLKNIYTLLSENAAEIEKAYPPIACNVCGYELRNAIADGRLRLHKVLGGSEGTFVVVTKLTFKIIRKKPFDSLIIAYFNDKISSAKASQLALTYNPAGIEIMDKSLIQLAVKEEPSLEGKLHTDIDNVLMIEFDGDTVEEVKELASTLVKEITGELLTQNIFVAVTEDEKSKFWAVRKAAVPILYQLKGKKKILALVEDAAVPTDTLTDYFEGLYKIFERHDVRFVTYGHIAKGLLHNRPLLDMKDPYDIDLLKVIADEVFELVMKLNGTISGEHGDGRLRSCYIPRQYSTIFGLFNNIKALFDPENLFNPDIKTKVDEYQMKKHLRYGADYGAVDYDNKQLIWDDSATFIEEAEKCHGCSKCTTVTTATRMCPVYKATRDEAAAPKAKANVLRTMLSGVIDKDAIYEESFQYVMERCINCGSCAIECPSKVNIPKLALEAKSRYAEKHGVPLNKKIYTNFELAGKTIRKLSPVISATMGPKLMRKLPELFVGLSAKREFIKFSPQSLFEQINKNEKPETENGKTVLFFAGCYTSYIKPEIGVSTVNVLKHLGYKVVTPDQTCCGIPHLSKGMAASTRKQIAKNKAKWGKLLDSVDYVVSACTSCVMSLTKEWGYYTQDEFTKKVAEKTVSVTSLIKPLLDDAELLSQDIKLAYHMPCHMRGIKDSNSSLDVMKKLPMVQVEDLKSNCCGMAGSFGMAAKNYDLSVTIGKPMVEKLVKSEAQIGVTDCPTCAMQMVHLGDKPVLHPIEVVDRCLKNNMIKEKE